MVAKWAERWPVAVASKSNDRNFQVPKIGLSPGNADFETSRENCVTSVAFIAFI